MSAAYERPSSDEMVALGRQLWGEPNKEQSTRCDIRFGSGGSKCINLDKLVWSDYETGEAGGYVDLRRKAHGEPPKQEQRTNGHDSKAKPQKRIVATYPYHGQHGELRFEVVRYEPKSFSQRRPDGNGGYIWNLKGVDRVPYRLPQLLAADPEAIVFIPEGEKHVDALMKHGLVATTNPMGTGKWSADFNNWLADRHVVVLPDNDDVGKKHADEVAASLSEVAASVRVLLLPDLRKVKDDVINWFEYGHTTEELLELAKAEPPPANDDQPGQDDDQTSVSEVIDEFNSTYMVVNDGGRAVVFRDNVDPVLNRHYFERIKFEDFRGLYLNRRVKTGQDENGKPKYAQAADLWLRNRKRRQYIGGVVFDPTGKDTEGTLNLWRGFGVTPRPGSWQLLKDHLLKVICAGSQELCEYVLNWSARLVQFPAEQGEVAIVMKGGEGAGKGIYARALKKLLGQHGLHINNQKHLTGVFNSHLRDCIFLFADECFFAGDKQHVGTLKALITEPTITIEGKYQNAVEAPNFLHVCMASNEEWVIPASTDSRRWLVLKVLDIKKGNTAYFDAIYKELDNGGYDAMLHELLHRDISGFNLRKVPVTEGLEEQRKLSLPIPERWWLDVLHRGFIFTSKLGLESYFQEWHDKVSTELLFASYSSYAEKHRDRHPLSRELFGSFLTKTVKASGRRLRSGVVGEHIADVQTDYGSTTRKSELVIHPRPQGYELGDLEKCRIAFEVATGLVFDWPTDDDGED